MRGTDQLIAAIEAIPVQFARMQDELAAGLQEFHNGQELRAARPLQIGATGANTLAWAGPARLVGWSVRATDGPMTVLLRDARSDSGDILAAIELAAGQSQTVWLGPGGVSAGEGIYVQAVQAVPATGAIQGAIYLGSVD